MKNNTGMVVAPHHLAAEAGAEVLAEGGNAIEAMVTAAAVIAVVYPHMNTIGGDGFWLMHQPGAAPTAIDACGRTAAGVELATYHGRDAIPFRGPDAAITVAGTVSGWDLALQVSGERWSGRMPLSRLLAPATGYARAGFPVTPSQVAATRDKQAELAPVSGFASAYLVDGEVPWQGSHFRQSRLADTLDQLVASGLDDFYRGDLARSIAGDLESVGSPVRHSDLQAHRASEVAPLRLQMAGGEVFNLPPPTQGLASLMILGLYERIASKYDISGELAYVHAVVEATKLAFRIRNREIVDPAWMRADPVSFLRSAALDELVMEFDAKRAAPWPEHGSSADTVWLGAIDSEGRSVSFIQSIYHEFGSGVVLPGSGICWQNRGCSFSLDPSALNALEPGKKPFHTLNPALAVFNDGRSMVYGAMGGDGQPQTQAAVFTRHIHRGLSVNEAVDEPRWLLGRTWGQSTDTLKVEARFDSSVIDGLRALGHEVEVLDDYTEVMGHAGIIVRDSDGEMDGSSDPRSDGAACFAGAVRAHDQ